MDDTNTNPEDKARDNTLPDSLSTSDPNDDTKTLIAVESQIKMNMAKIERVKKDLQPVNEMLKNLLENDESYVKLSDIAKKAAREKSARKKDLLSTQNGKELLGKITAFKEELADAQEALSYYLSEYQKSTGLNEFEGEDGELRQIVYVAKLVRKTNLNRG
ncbi:hypothetical protein IPM62_05790 [Candidatus Woesebacteria bacterium]|nr:MAG: hypothetical protein IPM62_05790 [Candidatus Woesebacteria bacterium]